ncbi:unnamed protein product [Sphacelaria rigidula]
MPAVHWSLNTSYRRRYDSTPYHVMFGRDPRTSFSVLASSSAGEWKCDVLESWTCKKAIVRALRSILSEQRRPVSEWVDVLPAAQRALNGSFRERYRNTSYCVMSDAAIGSALLGPKPA